MSKTRSPLRRLLSYWGPRCLFLGVVAGQLYFIVRGYTDPHKHFAFQPFNDSDQWHADIVRVDNWGQRHSIKDAWFGYRWHDLVRVRGLAHLERWQPADSGVRSAVVFLEGALNWVAEHTPKDGETLYYEARVEYVHNRRGPFTAVVKSRPRLAVSLDPLRRAPEARLASSDVPQ